MKQEKIDFIRNYYELSEDVENSEISVNLYESLGAAVFDIQQFKKELSKAFVTAVMSLRQLLKV